VLPTVEEKWVMKKHAAKNELNAQLILVRPPNKLEQVRRFRSTLQPTSYGQELDKLAGQVMGSITLLSHFW